MHLGKNAPVFLFFLLCFSLVLCGCTKSSYLAVASTEINTDQRLARTYQQLDGKLNQQIKITTETTMTIQVNNKAGSLNIIIYNENDTPCFSQTPAMNETYQTVLSPGTYQIQIQADKHQGSYDISW